MLVVHNETSTGATSRLAEIRRAIDRAKHPALFFVDAVSSLASIDLRQDEWGIDVDVAGSQKGLMLPPGLSFNAISDKALAASQRARRCTKSYWAWEPMLAANAQGFFPYTPSTNLLYGLREALRMLREEGLDQVFARHRRLAAARARGGPRVGTRDPLPVRGRAQPGRDDGDDAERARRRRSSARSSLERFNLSLGTGLGRLKGRAFRIGHLGDFNELMLMGTLCGVEMGLALAGRAVQEGRRRCRHGTALMANANTISRQTTPRRRAKPRMSANSAICVAVCRIVSARECRRLFARNAATAFLKSSLV